MAMNTTMGTATALRLRLPTVAVTTQNVTVNGFDETFSGWGHEDADLVLRLHNQGLVRKNGHLATEVFHLWHREASRQNEAANRARVQARLLEGTRRAAVGLEQADAARASGEAGGVQVMALQGVSKR